MPKGGAKKKGHKPEPAPRVEPQQPPQEIDVDESVGLGLGLDLGGNKRKQKKEKKQQMQELAKQAIVSSERSSTASREQSEPPQEETKPVESNIDVTEEFKGLGLGEPKKKRPKKKKTDASGDVAQAAPAIVAAQPAVVTPPVAPASAFSATAFPAPGFAAPSYSATQMPTSSTFPPPGLMPPPRSALANPTPSTSGWGRGRGRGQPPLGASYPEPLFPVPTPQIAPVAADEPQPVLPKATPTPQISRISQKPTSQFSHENIMCKYKIPLKVPGRTVGSRPLTLLTNYLEMTFKPYNISRYDVSFTPDRPKKMIPEVFKKLKQKFYPKELLAFDQTKNCYSLRPLANVPPNERFNTVIELEDTNGRLMKFEVSLKATGGVELGKIKRYMSERGASVLHPTEEVQCIDVILRQGTLESYVKAGRQFFKRPQRPVDLGQGYEMWTGLFQSAIFTSKAFINIDVAHKGFPKKQSLVSALVNDFNLSTDMPVDRQRSMDRESFLDFVKGLRVVATLVGSSPSAGHKREYICNGLVKPPFGMSFLLNEPNGKQRSITVAEYFAKEKKYTIKYPNLNCVWVGPKEKSIYFPMELLEIAYGQPLARQLTEGQVSRMVREAATPPNKRLEKITEVISSMKYSTNPDFKKFGLEISDKFYQVNAKILAPPTLDIGRGNTIPRKGMWSANHLLKPETLPAWGFIAIETSPNNEYDKVIQMLIGTGKDMGMTVPNPMIRKFDVALTSLHNVLRHAIDNGIKFMFVVVSTRGRDHYHKIKQMAEREVGMLTQCVKETTARRMNIMTAKNILLKVNSKLMGINQALGDKTMPRCLKDGGVMIVGADVTHPSPDQCNVPSIAAVTASIDPKCYMYNIELSVQTPKKEMIVQFEEMMYDHLKVYKERNMNQLPRKIFVFRDGVSEGQFVQVMNSELAAVHRAYASMAGATRKPEVLFLLVQKRHHTRFFNKGESSQYNVEPGTVVDTDIVHSSELDFYLVSHQALKGTARPTRYHAVCNDGSIPDDEVEQLTYYLCHLYSRCMRSVSYPTPTYYAHLACLRARSLTYGQKFNNKELEKKPERLHVLDKMLQYSRMFFV